MDTLSEMRGAVQSDLTAGAESTFYDPTSIDLAINRAYRKIGAKHYWPELKDSKKTTTQANQNYYDYPSTWKSNSIWKLVINDIRYGESPDGSPLSFDDYLNWKEDEPNSTDKRWANQWRRYFASPTPTTAGLVICIWGYETTTTLTEDKDDTVFSYHAQNLNEAIVLEASAILKAKGDLEKAGEFRSLEAKGIVADAWKIIEKSNAKYEKDYPMFEVPDYFGSGGGTDLRGRFRTIV